MTIETIDLAKHAVIEASAGTGKTHTIEQLVLRILVETETPLDKILLVTFTEKATGELKERLRNTLDRRDRRQVPATLWTSTAAGTAARLVARQRRQHRRAPSGLHGAANPHAASGIQETARSPEFR